MTIASGQFFQLVLAVFVCLAGEAGKGVSSISHQTSSGFPHGEAHASLNGSVLLVLGGGPTVLLDRQRESQVMVFQFYSKKPLSNQVLDTVELIGCPQGGLLLPPYPR